MKLDLRAASIIAVAILAVGGISSLSAQQQATLVRLFLGNAVVSASNPLPVAATITPSGTQDINIKQVQGAAPSATNPIWVAPATASTPWAVSVASGQVAAGAYASGAFASGSIASGAMVDLGAIADAAATAGSTGSVSAKLRLMTTQLGTINTTLGTPFQAGGSIGNTTFASTQSGTWTVQPGNTPNTTPWLTTNTPSSAAGAAVTSASSTAAASNLVLKASAGNLYHLTATIGATSGYLLLFDATSLPSNGAVTPVLCYPVTSNGTNGGVGLEFSTPKRFGTGITAGFSTTGCFTLTASATANFFGGYQ